MNFTTQDQVLIKEYFTFFKKIEKELTKELLENVNTIPSFKEIIESTPSDEMERNSKVSRKIQEEAIFQNKWKEFYAYHSSQGASYAKLGIPLEDWFDLTSALRYFMIKKLNKVEFKDNNELYNIITGMD